ncbi:SWIB/MDM2 domain, partial [Dillenia turbinata]
MAVSLGIFSTLLPSDFTCLLKASSSSASSLFFISPSQTSHRPFRIICCNAASPKSASATGKREPRGIMKPRRVSPEMQDLVGVPEIPRTRALKLIWAYIKEHNLQWVLLSLLKRWFRTEYDFHFDLMQLLKVVAMKINCRCNEMSIHSFANPKPTSIMDPENKKIIVCDEKLKKIFGGKDRVGFLEIAGLINPHFLKYLLMNFSVSFASRYGVGLVWKILSWFNLAGIRENDHTRYKSTTFRIMPRIPYIQSQQQKVSPIQDVR